MFKKNFIILYCVLVFVSILTLQNCNTVHNSELAQQQLGHYLFFDTRISLNNTKSCASCHNPNFAFTDGYRTSATALGENVLHNAPSLINIIYFKKYDWANPNASTLQQQIQRPLYGKHPIELGLDRHLKELQQEFSKDSLYKILFQQAFPNDSILFTQQQIETALVAYEKTLTSLQSQFDKQELSIDAYNGLKLFTSKKLNCVVCHPPPYFSLATQSNNIDSIYANIGLYNIGNNNEYPKQDEGLSSITKNKKDNGKFKIPSLRNVMLTAPYMHDGSVATIEEVIEIYARGGRKNKTEDGKLNANKHQLIKGFEINEKEKKELIAFLYSLTDSSIFYKQNFQNPFGNK